MAKEVIEQPENIGFEIDRDKLESLIQEIRSNQRILAGTLAGIVAASVGAIIWAAITAATEYQISWMAIGVGFLVGCAVQIFGKGVDKHFGVVGAVLSLLGCLAGNLLTVCIVVAEKEQIPRLDLLSHLNLRVAVDMITITFEPIDLLFYGIALFVGYFASFRNLSEEELAQALTRTDSVEQPEAYSDCVNEGQEEQQSEI